MFDDSASTESTLQCIRQTDSRLLGPGHLILGDDLAYLTFVGIRQRVLHGLRIRSMVMTRTGAITLKGTPTDLAGPELKVGDAAPDFILQNNALEEVSQDSFVEKTLIIATVPSLDTPVCHAETKKFNEQALDLATVEVDSFDVAPAITTHIARVQ